MIYLYFRTAIRSGHFCAISSGPITGGGGVYTRSKNNCREYDERLHLYAHVTSPA